MSRLVWISSAIGTVVLSASYRQKLYKNLPDFCKEICDLVQDWFIGGKQIAAETTDRKLVADAKSATTNGAILKTIVEYRPSRDRLWAIIFNIDAKTWLVIIVAASAVAFVHFRYRRHVMACCQVCCQACCQAIGNFFAHVRAFFIYLFNCCYVLFRKKKNGEEEPIWPTEQDVRRSVSPAQNPVEGDAKVEQRNSEIDEPEIPAERSTHFIHLAIDLGSTYHGYAYVSQPAKSVVQRKSEYKHSTGYIAPKQMSIAFQFNGNSSFCQTGAIIYGFKAEEWLDRCLTSRGNNGESLPLHLKECCSQSSTADSKSTAVLYLPEFWQAIKQDMEANIGERIDEKSLHVTVVAANVNNHQPGSSEFEFVSSLWSRLQEKQVRYMRDTDAAALQVFHDYGDRHLRKIQRYIVVNFGGHHCSMGVYHKGALVATPVPTLAMGGSHVTEELLTLIQKAIGEDVMEEFRNQHPSSWASIKYNMEKKSDTLVLGTLEEFLTKKGLLHRLEGGLKFNSFGGRICLCIPEDMIEAAYAIIIKSSFVQKVCDYTQRDSSKYVFVVGGLANEKRIKQFVKKSFSKEVLFPTDLESYPMLGGCLPGP